MYDNIASWMIAGGVFEDEHDQRATHHRIAVRESRRAAKADRPSLLDRARARFGPWRDAPTADCVA